jgi:hypothetical protein
MSQNSNGAPYYQGDRTMTPIEKIQQDIQTLPADALDLLAQFIQLLKKSHPSSPEKSSNAESTLLPQPTDWSDFIGCMEAEEDLAVNYKDYLSEELVQKYDHH